MDAQRAYAVLERPHRSVCRITHGGRDVLATNPDRVDLLVLSQFEEFHESRRPRTDPLVATGARTAQIGAERFTGEGGYTAVVRAARANG
jgi:restriction endonuclease Mrr